MRRIQHGHPLRRQLREQGHPAGGVPLVGLLLAVALVYQGVVGHPAGAARPELSAIDPAALPTAIDGHGPLPLPSIG
ncbi:MAG: hypothetical protein ACFCVH_02055 [Alphaproteobacteria bacterium]